MRVNRLTLLAVAGALLAVAAGALAPRLGDAQGENRAGLVVQYGDGSVQTFCVGFPGPSISGEDLLRTSGLNIVAVENSSFGAGICQISGEGCPDPNNCFCQCQGGSCEFWRYYHQDGGAWAFSAVGASGWLLEAGDVDGWAWGPDGTSPPVIPFEQICAVEPTPEPTQPPPPPPTETPPPSPTLAEPTATSPPPTPAATETASTQPPSPSATPTPTASPTREPTATASRTPTATPEPASSTPTAEGPRVVASTGEAPDDGDDEGGSGPWAYALFGVLAVGLVAAAVYVGRRRGI
jgi:hypothetical protein